MGILDRFRKEETTHFYREEEVDYDAERTRQLGDREGPTQMGGAVVHTSTEKLGRKGTPISDALLAQEKKDRKTARQELKEQTRVAYEEEFAKARVARAKRKGKQAGSSTMLDRMIAPATSHKIRNNYNPFGSMYDRGINYGPSSLSPTFTSFWDTGKPRLQPKKRKKKKYVAIGGKAYPVAKSKKKKASKNDWDVFGAFGGYKF